MIAFLYLCKKCHWNFDAALNLQVALVSMNILTVLILSSHKHDMSFYLYLLQFLSSPGLINGIDSRHQLPDIGRRDGSVSSLLPACGWDSCAARSFPGCQRARERGRRRHFPRAHWRLSIILFCQTRTGGCQERWRGLPASLPSERVLSQGMNASGGDAEGDHFVS